MFIKVKETNGEERVINTDNIDYVKKHSEGHILLAYHAGNNRDMLHCVGTLDEFLVWVGDDPIVVDHEELAHNLANFVKTTYSAPEETEPAFEPMPEMRPLVLNIPVPDQSEELELPAKEAAEYLKISTKTLYSWASQGKIKSRKDVTGKGFYIVGTINKKETECL